MGYGLGVDLGATTVTAAVARGGHVEPVPLGRAGPAAASAVLARPDGTLGTGDEAVAEVPGGPGRLASGVRLRLGDPTPLLLGGVPRLPATLLAAQLRDVVAAATRYAGGFPEVVVLTHPAVWGPYRREQFAEVSRLAGLDPARLVTEAEAAAAGAADGPAAPDDLLLVYDFGGATFSATVLRASVTGWQQAGPPGGLDALGGADLDDAVVAAVDEALGGAVGALDPAEPAAAATLARLRADCRGARESLSERDGAVVRVELAAGRREVRLTRTELERRIRPVVQATLEAVHEVLAAAGVAPAELADVLMVGGCSATPVVRRCVEEDLGRPVRVPAGPAGVVALGAARLAGHVLEEAAGGERDGPAADPGAADRPPAAGARPADGVAGGRPADADYGRATPPSAGRSRAAGRRRAAAAGRRRRWPVVLSATAVLVAIGVTLALVLPDRGGGGEPGGLGVSLADPVVVTTIAGLGRRPEGIAVTPDGTAAWVPEAVAGTVQVLDLARGRVERTLRMPAPPRFVVLTPDGTRAYITLDAPTGTNAVLAVDTTTFATVATIPAGAQLSPPAIAPDGRTLYVLDHTRSRVLVLDPATDGSRGGFGVDPAPGGAAFHPGGATAYVTNDRSGTVQVVDVAAGHLTSTFAVGSMPMAVAVSPDGRLGATANYYGESTTLFDTATDKVVTTVKVGLRPRSVAWAPDGAHLYVVDSGSDDVSVVDVRTRTVTATVPVGREPWTIAVDRRGRRAYVTNATGDSVSVLRTAD